MKKRTRKSKTATLRIPDCKHFTGYKPCFPATRCYQECVDNDPIGKNILIVNLDAMGNVLVTASLLPPLKKKYPRSSISWITLKNAAPLLANNPLVDRVYLWEPESWLILGQMRFDVVLNVDKSARSCALTKSLTAGTKLGFGLNDDGVIVPLNKEARENYLLGLDDTLKFRVNRKTVPQLQCEQFRLPYKRDRYRVYLTEAEKAFCEEYKRECGIRGDDLVLGFNTGCSELYPNKKMTIDQHVALIRRFSTEAGIRMVLLGGPEDTLRNAEIARQVGDAVISSPTTEGVRRGLCYISLCDVVISGDSFGMHAAIALQKYVVVWFGVSCWTEIDLFDNGVKLIPEGLACSPCWKKECPYNLECIQMIDRDAIIRHVLAYRDGRSHVPPARVAGAPPEVESEM